MPDLPQIPKVELEVVADRSAERDGFLTLRRVDLVVRSGEAPPSRVFRYDMVERRAMDACVMIAHYEEQGRVYVYLRSAIRPPAGLRADIHAESVFWEVPAGLIEPGESPAEAAAREVDEELGFAVSAGAMKPLGGRMFPAPALLAEVQWFFHVRVDPKTRRVPGGDGSPIEEGALVASVPLDDALAACRRGELRDAKTELALRRLSEVGG